MVWKSADSVDVQKVRHLFNLLAAETVDDAGTARILFYVADDILFGFVLATYLISEVRPVEGRLEDGRIHDAETLLDVALDFRCRRGGQGDDRSPADGLDHVSDPPVLRPEVVPPFRNAVRFIHSIERDVDLLEKFHILHLGQRLGSDIEQFRDT